MSITELSYSLVQASAAVDGRFTRDSDRIVKLEAALRKVRYELAALTPNPAEGGTLAAWEALCPKNAADRACLANAWRAIEDASLPAAAGEGEVGRK